MDTYVVKRLEQAKLLTDPFKLKLLERFGGKPVTTKQVADRMGEKAPRLYRHVDALVDEGLLELVEEKPKRGTIERYYRTVASRFEVDPALFSTSSGVGDDAVNMLRGIQRDTESDLAARVLQREHQLLPQVVDWFAQGKLQLRGDRVWFEDSPLQAPIQC